MIIAGMNCIFIYLFKELLGGWTDNFIGIFTMPILEHIGVVGKILHKNIVLIVLWCLSYWLFKHRIFLKI
ncbi:hypothetical protein ES708_33006 [subsurface metagenome]